MLGRWYLTRYDFRRRWRKQGNLFVMDRAQKCGGNGRYIAVAVAELCEAANHEDSNVRSSWLS